MTGVVGHHRNITSTFVAKKMYGVILDKMDYETALIIRDIEQNFQYVISYAKTWRAKQKLFEMRFGTYEASYDNLPRMLEAMCTEILKVLLIHTVYRACQGGQAFCCELSSALEHV